MTSTKKEKRVLRGFFENERRLWSLLPPGIKRSNRKLLFALGFGAILELGGVAIFLPVFSFLGAANPLEAHPRAARFFTAIGAYDRPRVVTALLIILAGFFLLKSSYMVALSWKQGGILTRIRKYFQDSVFEGFLRSSYEFHLGHHSARLVAQIVELGRLLPLLTVVNGMFIDIALIVLIVGFIAVMRPAALAVLMVFALLIFAMLRFTKVRNLSLGQKQYEFQLQASRRRVESLTGIKDAILYNRIPDFIKRHRATTEEIASIDRRLQFYSQINRPVVELLGVLMLLLVIAIQEVLAMRHGGSAMGGTVAFAVALVRAIPAVNRLAGGVQMMRSGNAMIGKAADVLQQLRGAATAPWNQGKEMPFSREIRLENVSYRYPNAAAHSLSDVSLSIQKNQSVGIIGTTGAGKSTLVDVLLGLLTPSHGSILVDGRDIREGLPSWRANIGYVSQSIFLSDDTIRRNIAYGIPDAEIDEQALAVALGQAQISQFIQNLPKNIETVVGERGVSLSGGQRQRVAIARALYHQPEILVFDEATSALDNETEKAVMEAIDQFRGNRTLIIIAHRLSTIENCDVVIRLEGGRVAEIRSRTSGGSTQVHARQDGVRPIS